MFVSKSLLLSVFVVFFYPCFVNASSATAVDVSTATPSSTSKAVIEHVIVLMLENRAFDHMFGYYPKEGTNNLLNHTFFNWLNASNPAHPDGRIYATPNAPYLNMCDPDHSLPGTTYKLYGYREAQSGNLTIPNMASFIEEERYVGFHNETEYCNVMQGFTPDRVPIISTLADEFVLFDDFYASVPGPTWPNRLFFFAASSGGLTETGPWYQNVTGTLFPMPTIYDQVMSLNGTWKHYYNDTPWELFIETVATHPENVVGMDTFYDDAKKGTFPDFSFINPRCGVNVSSGEGANDQHPDHDVALGEKYLKDIYEAIRASPAWNKTLFVVTYDEHGGFFDHVAPPSAGVPGPNPGQRSYPDAGFTFDRLGVRIPMLLVSPWVPKGLVQGAPPPAQKPTPTSAYDLTSIMASVRKLLKLFVDSDSAVPPLTPRDGWAATFEHLFETMSSPRTDCPMHLPEAPVSTHSVHHEGRLPVNGLQRDIAAAHIHSYRHASGGTHLPSNVNIPDTQAELSRWLQELYQSQRAVHQKKTLKHLEQVAVRPVLATLPDDSIVQYYWLLQDAPMTNISSLWNDTWYCLDAMFPQDGTNTVRTVPCSETGEALLTQQWTVGFEHGFGEERGSLWVRSKLDPTRCLTGHILAPQASSSSSSHHAVRVVPSVVTLELCEDSRYNETNHRLTTIQQRWATGGTAAGIGPLPQPWGGQLFSVGPFLLCLQLQSTP